MNCDITEPFLNMLRDVFLRETQNLMSKIKNSNDNQQFHEELKIINNIEINILKLRDSRKNFQG